MTVMMLKILGCGLRAAVLVVAVAELLDALPTACAADWPQWRGPNRDGSSTETGWRSQWPEGGPKVLWKAKVGAGHSSVIAVGERAYAVGRSWKVDAKGLPVKGENGKNVGSETVISQNPPKPVWSSKEMISYFQSSVLVDGHRFGYACPGLRGKQDPAALCGL